MLVIPGNDLLQRLGERPRTVVFKAVDKRAPQAPVVSKVFKGAELFAHRKAQFRQRIEHLKVLSDPSVITPTSFETRGNLHFVVQPYFDGVTLDECARRGLSLKESLTLASKLALAIERIHEAGILHGGIKPHNILVRPDTLDLRIIDFLPPLDVREVSHFIYDPSFVAGPLVYTSPEQTGRPAETIELLELCACMGNTFAPEDLALIREVPLIRIFELLMPALNRGLLVEARRDLQFIHDRVQEAVLVSIHPERRRDIHSQIGRHLLAAIPEGTELESLDHLFAIASHLNLARGPDLARDAAYQLSRINFHAGQKALNALATQAANEYFRLSKELLPQDAWEAQHAETFRIYQKLAKTELMCGNVELSEHLLDQLLEHARSELDKAECLAEQTATLSSIGNFIKAIETANRGLAYFERSLPDDDGEADRRRAELMREIDATQADVWGTILHMPFTRDRKRKIELAFYSELIPDLYMSGLVPQLYLSAVQSTQHCLAGGMDESVIYSFSIMGLQLGEQDDFERAFKYEDLARELSARHPNTFGATRGMNGIVWCNMHSRSHPAEIAQYCLQAIQSGKNCGDLYNAGLSYGPLMWNQQVQGADLRALEATARECMDFSRRFHLGFSVALASAMQAGWIEPMKTGQAPVSMDDELERWERNNYVAAAGSYFVHRALTHYYLGEYEQAADALARVRRYLTGLTDNVLKRQWYVFQVLNAAALFEAGLGKATLAELHAECDPIIAKVERWAALGPLLRPYVAFMHAELALAAGDRGAARGRYLDAIDLAHELGYAFLAGHLCERLGDLLLSERRASARIYLREAGRLYARCHASRKHTALLEKFPEHLEDELAPPSAVPGAPEPDGYPAYTLPDLDVDYLIKSSHAIAAEIEPDALMHRIMELVLESSGAQHGYLLMAEEGDLVVRNENHLEAGDVRSSVDKRAEDVDEICKPIIRYVYRSRQKVMIDDTTRDSELKDHPEVQAVRRGSVLCVPVLKWSRLVGVLYLENRLADGVFTAGRMRMTELLASQAAISLENARLLRASQAAVQIRDEFLSVAAHELRTPLTALTLQLQGLAHQLTRPSSGPRQPHPDPARGLDLALRQTDRLARLIENLLDVSRISLGKLRLELDEVDLGRLVREAAERYEQQARAAGCALSVRQADRVVGRWDSARLDQVVTNLLSNAIKYGAGHPVELSIARSGPDARLTVTDEGIGIPSQDGARILDRFERAVSSRHYGGLGLGLYISKQIIEAHGGEIHADARSGGGSVFVVTLPISPVVSRSSERDRARAMS